MDLRRPLGCVLLGCLSGPGCARPAAPVVGPAGEVAFVRRVAPFPVLGPDGEPYAFPFLGGLNQPRPQLVDIDGDGDEDVFVQEASGSVMFFERITGDRPRLEWRTDRFEGLDVGEWYRFVDLDRDGDADLLAERTFSYVRYYRNDGSARAPHFILAADTLRDVSGAPIYSDRQNIPNATDIDCDGRIDLLIGHLDGTVSRYEEEGFEENGVPRFRLLTDRFEDIEIVAQIGSAHGANTMALGDVDDDGDVDLFWGDFFESGILFLENRGTCQAPRLRGEPRSFPLDRPLKTSGYNAPTLGDVDADGDTDLLVGVLGGAFNPNTTTVDNFHYLEHLPDGRFVDRTSRFLTMLDVGSESVPVTVDLDGDGDLDLLVGNKIEPGDPLNGKLYRFLNEGTPGRPLLRAAGVMDVGAGYHLVPAFGDLDGDGDLDAVLGTWGDRLRLYLNHAATGVELTLADSALISLSRGRNATPALGDLDGDGDLDLLVGESSGTLNHFENTGTSTAPEFKLITDGFGDIDVGRRSFPVLNDVDGDGDLDLLVGSESGGIHLFRNLGTAALPRFSAEGTLPVETFGFAAPALADMDGDGDDDLVLGGTGGGLWFFENRPP